MINGGKKRMEWRAKFIIPKQSVYHTDNTKVKMQSTSFVGVNKQKENM